jgi:hypothetical protein
MEKEYLGNLLTFGNVMIFPGEELLYTQNSTLFWLSHETCLRTFIAHSAFKASDTLRDNFHRHSSSSFSELNVAKPRKRKMNQFSDCLIKTGLGPEIRVRCRKLTLRIQGKRRFLETECKSTVSRAIDFP